MIPYENTDGCGASWADGSDAPRRRLATVLSGPLVAEIEPNFSSLHGSRSILRMLGWDPARRQVFPGCFSVPDCLKRRRVSNFRVFKHRACLRLDSTDKTFRTNNAVSQTWFPCQLCQQCAGIQDDNNNLDTRPCVVASSGGGVKQTDVEE